MVRVVRHRGGACGVTVASALWCVWCRCRVGVVVRVVSVASVESASGGADSGPDRDGCGAELLLTVPIAMTPVASIRVSV